MGCSDSKFLDPDERAKDGTMLVEMKVGHMRDAHDVVGLVPDNFVPVSIVPRRWASDCCCCCCCCWTSVPSGFSAIVSKWGKDTAGSEDDGSWDAGFHWLCPWHRVNRLVSRQLIIFDTPVKSAKTKDHIPVNIDVLIVFEIVQAADFIYNVGPEKFDDILRSTQEETIRQIASETPVENIYDLYGGQGGQEATHNDSSIFEKFIERMNDQFSKYGVKVHNFTVRNVSIPQAMASDLEEKTLYESRTVEKQMEQVRDRLSLDQDEARMKLQEECENARMALEEQNVTALAELVKDVRTYEAIVKKEQDLKVAEREAEVTDIKAKSELELAQIRAEIMAMQRENEAKLQLEEGTLEANAEAYEQKMRATGKVEASAKVALGKKEVGRAEGGAASAFQARREQEQNLLRLGVIDKLADNKNIQVATTLENNSGLAPNNSLVTQITQQGMEAVRTRLAEWTTSSATRLNMGSANMGGVVRPTQQVMAR
jgi:regulator of protease activity HflC (stomatin/prohibitin superfamily)